MRRAASARRWIIRCFLFKDHLALEKPTPARI
jgi:hypothetical protein